jgi:PAT family beta-lactamase induction signal transducer AmpG
MLIVTFASASQDIVLDAYRRELFSIRDFGLANSLFVSGYRIGMLISGPIALGLANTIGWPNNYLACSATMVALTVVTVFAPYPPKLTSNRPQPPSSIRNFFLELRTPLKDFFKREQALAFLALIFFYKLGDMLASTMTIPFYKEIGFSNEEIGAVAKVFGLLSQIIGGIVGGVAIRRLRMHRALWYFGWLQALGVLGFGLLYFLPKSLTSLALVVSFENFSIGLGTTAFVTCMGALCRREFSATQYALLSSLAGVPRTILGSSTGAIASLTGWPIFFLVCFLMTLPGLALVLKLKEAVGKQELAAD